MADDVEFRGGPIQVGAKWRAIAGHAHGLRGPVLLSAIRWPEALTLKTAGLADMLNEFAGLANDKTAACIEGGMNFEAFVALALEVETAAQSPVTQRGRALDAAAPLPAFRHGLAQRTVAFPAHEPRFTQMLVEWLSFAINSLQGNLPAVEREALVQPVNQQFADARAAFRKRATAPGVNTMRIMRACGEMGLPLQMLAGGYLHVGSGQHARLFKSTLTEVVPALSVGLARSKSATAALLGRQGLPVPRHKLVASADDAVKFANEIGYPVVIKPDDRDGGEGVHAGLENEEQVRQCHALTAAISERVLVEAFVEGLDYRLTVENGKVVKAIGRQPGGVLGDGVQTVSALVDAEVASTPALRGLKSALCIDDEANDLLAMRGMNAQSVPPAGEFIALRRRANTSTGGKARDAMAQLHPDNARLAIRATNALRLDLSGIDIIIPDIGVSWMQSKAIICEVNAQPQIRTEFATDVYRDMLMRLVPPPQRLRAVLVLDVSGKVMGDAAVAAVAAELTRSGERVLSIRSDGTWLGDERMAPATANVYAAAVGAELEREATCAVVAFTPKMLLERGLPWLHLDEVRVVSGEAAFSAASLRTCLELLQRHLSGEVVLDAKSADALRDASAPLRAPATSAPHSAPR